MTYEYSIYDTATGLVIQSGIADTEADVQRVVQSGQAYVNEKHKTGYIKIIDGEVSSVDHTDPESLNRNTRDELLQAADWTQVPDSPLTDTKKTEWATYRQALRDLTNHSNWPNLNIDDWPSEPS